MAEKSITPTKDAMLLCDSIITEVGTGKKSLIGVFEVISTPELPCQHYSLSVYVKFTSALGDYTFNLKLIDLTKNEIIGEAAIPEKIKIKEKLISYELAFNLQGLKFNQAGKYEFQVFANNEMFANKTFEIIQIKQK